ncbi:MAG: hypothetical protein ACI9PP_000653 [Halobacteriales archaeon]|jgi:hypothetical protein
MRKLAIVLVTTVLLACFVGTAGADSVRSAAHQPAELTAISADEYSDRGLMAAQSNTTSEASDTHPPDPEEDVIGWEDGYWYNETIAVDRSDGLNETELDMVVARSMARVEVVRQVEFEKTVPVEVVSREEYKANFSSEFNYTLADRLHQNAKWEAMLMVNESTDATAVQEQNRGATVGGFYSPSEERIVIVSENTTSPKMNEITLSQELFHALQDQKFNLSSFDYSTQEAHNAADGVVEGDANLVDSKYADRCEAEWECLMPQASGGGGGGGEIHFGLYLVEFQPYSDGPPFVQGIYDEGGWEAVNDLYENPPKSTEQVIHPEKYGEEEPDIPEIEHTPSGDWQVLEMGEDSIDYAVFGEAGLSTMLFYPFYHSERTEMPVLGQEDFFNITASGQLSTVDPIKYENKYTAGWDGDKLVPYVKGEPSNDSKMGYVWKMNWDSEADAEEFVDGYTKLLRYYGAENVGGTVWKIPDGAEFADAFGVVKEGSTVTIVNGPTIESLQAIHAMEALDPSEETTTDTQPTSADPDPTTTESDSATTGSDLTTTGSEPTTTGEGGSSVPGFGFGVALLALAAIVGSALIARRNQ